MKTVFVAILVCQVGLISARPQNLELTSRSKRQLSYDEEGYPIDLWGCGPTKPGPDNGVWRSSGGDYSDYFHPMCELYWEASVKRIFGNIKRPSNGEPITKIWMGGQLINGRPGSRLPLTRKSQLIYDDEGRLIDLWGCGPTKYSRRGWTPARSFGGSGSGYYHPMCELYWEANLERLKRTIERIKGLSGSRLPLPSKSQLIYDEEGLPINLWGCGPTKPIGGGWSGTFMRSFGSRGSGSGNYHPMCDLYWDAQLERIQENIERIKGRPGTRWPRPPYRYPTFWRNNPNSGYPGYRPGFPWWLYY